MKPHNTLQAELAAFIVELKYEKLPSDIIEDTKYRVLDWLGSALAGAHYKPSLIITEMIRSAGGTAQATLIKGNQKVPVAQAALVNGVIGHVAEFDDGHRLAIAHPGAVTVPTSLAVAECFARTGKELLTAVVAGYEILIRLGAAINPSHYKLWHTTGTCGAFAAAASAASLLKLDPQKTQMALGIAGTMASGLQDSFGTHAKSLNAGHACQSGIQAALLAMDGFTGAEDILLGKKGFIMATSTDYNTKLLEEINQNQYVSNTAFYKVYASCGHTNSPLDAIFMIMEQGELALSAIKAVHIETYRTAVELTGKFKQHTEEAAKFSLPYCLAVALLYKKVTLDEFTLDKLNNPLIAEIASKISVFEDPEATKMFPKERRATVTLTLDNNQVISKHVIMPNDEPKYDSLKEKFMSLAVTCMERPNAQHIKDMILHLEKLDDLSALMKYLA